MGESEADTHVPSPKGEALVACCEAETGKGDRHPHGGWRYFFYFWFTLNGFRAEGGA